MAIPMILQIILAALFTPTVLRQFGINLTPTDVQNGVSAGPVAVPAPPTTPGAVSEPSKPPTAAETLNDAVNKPTSLFGIAAVGFVAVFVIAQLRAAGHEMTETTKDLYSEGKKVTGSLANADATTRNLSRRAKG
ncbi:hypothetical protein [Deinococcus sp. YIM 77859]|uniref:hypothetical protein n=1 Tax=Deinococcus sp. YIM 77859 TaxID=1540221 RepID=UPI00055174DB|nr:hypothetical protein [Deinococcus sp. YIM 77859]